MIFRVSFYDAGLDTEKNPIIFSAEKRVAIAEIHQSPHLSLTWVDEEMPSLVTAYNTVQLASQSSLLMMIWCKTADKGVT